MGSVHMPSDVHQSESERVYSESAVLPTVGPHALQVAYRLAMAELLSARQRAGYWEGELSSSALATAVAVMALSMSVAEASGSFSSRNRGMADRDMDVGRLCRQGLRWLAGDQNADGGWGDAPGSVSNISTTLLCLSAIVAVAGGAKARSVGDVSVSLPGTDASGCRTELSGELAVFEGIREAAERAQRYLDRMCGEGRKRWADAIRNRYGRDRTFSAPILLTAALAGLMDWSEVPALPYELACLPQSWYRFARLPVVSYALPALVAIGVAVDGHQPPVNPLVRWMRRCCRRRSLKVLENIQPSSGGFLEAIPLTSFVVMALSSVGQARHPVVRKGVEFLAASVRRDGSWAIDSNLSVWLTTMSVGTLASANALESLPGRERLTEWILRQQFRERHPYTGAAPGGWGWTHLPGSVPDADDTAGALLALAKLLPSDGEYAEVAAGLEWLWGLQNRDGGIPTFCRGWGHLPFDRSGSDLTAHALRAYAAWSQRLSTIARDDKTAALRRVLTRIEHRSAPRALAYLERVQRGDGSWTPLWFGNQRTAEEENPTYGTARVLAAYRDLGMLASGPAVRGVEWLRKAQNADGSWGGAAGVAGSIEETALAAEILLDAEYVYGRTDAAAARGIDWLIAAVLAGKLKNAEPIGFYFAKLWYFEKLYPIIFSVAALAKARRQLCPEIVPP